MTSNNKFSLSYILGRFSEENSIKQIKNLKNQLKQFELQNKNNKSKSKQEILIQNEQIILSIIANTLSEKAKLFINENNIFNFDLFIYTLLEIIKQKLSNIIKNSKGIENSLFHKINKNTIKKIQSIIVIFIISFYEFYEKDSSYSSTDDIIETITNKNVNLEESFFITCIQIILIINNNIDKSKIKNIFNENLKDNDSLRKELTYMLIKLIYTLIIIKKNKDLFNIENLSNSIISTNNLKNNKGFYNYDQFEIFINKTYETNISYLFYLLFDFFFGNNLKYFFSKIIKNDDISKILLNSLSFEKDIRITFLRLLKEAFYILDKQNQKDLLKTIKSNDTISIIFSYISEDLENKKYTEISSLLQELTILYIFSCLIHSHDLNTEKKIIQILNNNLYLADDKNDNSFNTFINSINHLTENMPKYKFKINNFLLLLFDSIKRVRKIISRIYFNNLNGNIEKYLEMTKNVSFNLFLDNLSSSEAEVINNFFSFLNTLDKNEYLPLNEIIQIIGQLPFFTDVKSTEALIENLKTITEINYLSNNEDIDIYNIEKNVEEEENFLKGENKEIKNNNSNKYYKFVMKIYQSYMNILYNIILEIKENINSLKNKSPFDIDVTVSSIINTNYSNLNEDINKKNFPSEILDILLDYLSIIIKDKKFFQIFISQKFLEFFSFLVNDNDYKRIAYKLIQIFLNSPSNDEKIKDKNKQQILIIINRFYNYFPKNGIPEEDENNNEIYKLKELLLMQNTIQIYFKNKLILDTENRVDNINEKITNFYFFYPEYINEHSNEIYQLYNDEYHSLIKQYLNIIFNLLCISNQNIITKNYNYSPINLKKNIKEIFMNIIKFFYFFPQNKKEIYFLDIIKYFIDKSFNFHFSKDANNDINNNNENKEEERLSEEDFSLFYINKYNIKKEILIDSNDNKNRSIISNFCIQSPIIILNLLKILYKYNKYLTQYLNFILFLCKINEQNILFLIRQNLLKELFKILKDFPSCHDIIFQICKLCFKYLRKEDICFVFEQLIKISNSSGLDDNNYENKDLIYEILHYVTNSLRILSITSNDYCKGIILSKYIIRQPNLYNILEINNLIFYDENSFDIKNNCNILIKQELYFYKSLNMKKLLLLRLEKQNNNNSIEKNNNNQYLEISFLNSEICISESDEQIKYNDLSNYNSIFIDNDKNISTIEKYLKLNRNNIIIYIFKEDKNILSIYINGNKVMTYKYTFNFDENNKIKIGFPLDLLKEVYDYKFKLLNHIKLKSFKIFLQKNDTREIVKNVYQLPIGKISCDYLFADELTNFKLDENTKLISKYNNLNSASINMVFHRNFIKSQFYKNIFFNQILLLHSLDYIFRIEKYIFVLLNYQNINKKIFNELISLLCIYLIINENFLQKFLTKEEFHSTLYFSLYRNAKFIDIETIENLLSIILIDDNKKNNLVNHNIIIDILLDIKLFDSLNNQTKSDLISSINNKIIQNTQSIVNKSFVIEKLSKILVLCQFNNKSDIDDLIINIIFEAYKFLPIDDNNSNILEEIVYILFDFDLFTSNHLSKFKNGRTNETSKIIYEFFNKIYNKDSILHLKELILTKLDSMILISEFKNKLFRLICAYSPPNLIDINNNKNDLNNDKNNKSKILNFEDDDDEDDDDLLFKLPSCGIQKTRSLSLSLPKDRNNQLNRTIKEDGEDAGKDEGYIDINKAFTKRIDLKKNTINNIQIKLFNKNKKNKKITRSRFCNDDFNNNSLRLEYCRQQNSIKPFDDVILFKGVINRKERKSYKKSFFKKSDKKKSPILINITSEDKENCVGDCHLCKFIKKLLISIFKREVKFGIYKNYLLHCLSEVFIMNKNLDFKYNFSYHLMKREGPNRIRKKFAIRIDKLLNSEYDRTAYERRNTKKDDLAKSNNTNLLKEKSIDLNDNKEILNENEIENLFMFYENKKKYISENLLNFYNLGQIYNIDIIPDLVDADDSFQCAFNCLLFKGFSYINSAFILGRNKIYILSSVNISTDSILYDAHFPITKRFWIVKKYLDILGDKCQYLSSFDDYYSNKNDNHTKKEIFEKTLKGFWLYSFYYVEINEIHKKKYLHQNNAIEIFLKNGKNYYLTFNMDIRDKLVKYIIRNIKYSHQSKNVAFFINNNYNLIKESQSSDIKNDNKDSLTKSDYTEDVNDNLNNMIYEIQNESLMKSDGMIFLMDSNIFIEKSKNYKKNNFYKNIFKNKKTKFTLATITDINEIIEKSYDKWTNGHLDTYSYIMILNTISGRTYNDIAQYPVYPWILSNYFSKELNLNDSESYRDFLYPIYAQDEETRENLKTKFDSFEVEQKEFKYHSGSHYSNAGFVCYYLIRIKPYSQLAAEVQGENFDTTDRLFFNIGSFYKVSEKYQELIPDIFNIPEIYINSNNFNLGLNSDGKNIDNVALPPWASHSPRLFCKIMKKSLESQYTSMNINNWIDLIFGYKQKGNEAEKYFNVLRNVCSGFNPKKDCEDEIEVEQKINELCELGIDPVQIFYKPHHRRERHQKIKAFFGRNIYLPYFKAKDEKILLKNLEKNCIIKEMNKYYEYSSKNLSKGEGGLSSFRMYFEDDNDNNYLYDNKDSNNNMIYFIISGKKTLLPPSYKNYIEWSNHNYFYIVKPFKKIKYKFIIEHMRKQEINCIKITKDGNFIIIGYNNGVIEKYKLTRIWGPKTKVINKENLNFNDNKENTIPKKPKKRTTSNDDDISEKGNLTLQKMTRPKEKSVHIKGGLFNTLFGGKNRKNTQILKSSQNNNICDDDDEEENKKIILELEKNILNKNRKKTSISNEIIFDTHIPASTSNIINSDCIILNNNTGKFIQYNSLSSPINFISEKKENENNIENNKNDSDKTMQIEIPGYDIYSNNKNNLNTILNKDNHRNSLSKHYIIFLINSSSRILSAISLIELCEPYSFMIVIDKFNNLYLYDFNTFDLIKYINCSIYFDHKIKYISIDPYTGDFILATYYKVILMSINGVFITQMNNIKSKINYCILTSIYNSSSDLYLFSAHEDGSLLVSKLINNLTGIIFNMNKCSLDSFNTNKLLNSMNISDLNNKYDPIRIKNISEVYHSAYETSSNDNKIKDKDKYKKYLENDNNFALIFDSPIRIKCSEYAIKYIKLSQDLSSLLCINNRNHLIYLDYEEFFITKRKNRDKKNMTYCEKCQNIISSLKTLCQICGKKLCSNCKTEKIIAEYSLKIPRPICDECIQLIEKNNQNLYNL